MACTLHNAIGRVANALLDIELYKLPINPDKQHTRTQIQKVWISKLNWRKKIGLNRKNAIFQTKNSNDHDECCQTNWCTLHTVHISSRPFMIYCNLIGMNNFSPFGSNKTIFPPNPDRYLLFTLFVCLFVYGFVFWCGWQSWFISSRLNVHQALHFNSIKWYINIWSRMLSLYGWHWQNQSG